MNASEYSDEITVLITMQLSSDEHMISLPFLGELREVEAAREEAVQIKVIV